MTPRTLIDVPASPEFWPTLEAWAAENGYRLMKPSQGEVRLYQKGYGFLVAPMMLRVEPSAGKIALQAWVRANLFIRISALFMLPAEISIETGGVTAILPRQIARKAVNKLLAKLGQPLIP